MAHLPYDIAGVEDELQDDERMVRDSVAKFVDAEVLPGIGRAFEEHRFQRERIAPMARRGLVGSSGGGDGCAGLNPVSDGRIWQ
ncbi:MAG: acyl-CoA dehydrogenase family protein, partial [Gammaproteobacteria bacterium]